MRKCYRITDASAIRGTTNAQVLGVPANYEEWEKHSFCPTKGVLGMLFCDGQTREGTVYILECMYHCLVPVLVSGVEEISEAYFQSNFREVNTRLGYDPNGSRCDKAKNAEIVNSLMSW